MSERCLNCDTITVNNFCSVCGQKNSTHRFSIKHFFFHDLIHGVFHFDKGFFFTLKELFTRPGHSIREYIQGKRVSHFNYFTLMLIIFTISHFIAKIPPKSMHDIMIENNLTPLNHKVIKEYAKYIMLFTIPFFASVTYIMFKKSKLNFTEHLVVSMYYMSAVLVFHIIPLVATIISSQIEFINAFKLITILLEYTYYFLFFLQFFYVYNFTKKELIIRSLITVCLFIFITGSVIGNLVKFFGLLFF